MSDPEPALGLQATSVNEAKPKSKPKLKSEPEPEPEPEPMSDLKGKSAEEGGKEEQKQEVRSRA